jgi:hypothetical protein
MSRWAPNPEVVCTELEDGAVVLNLETRLYYSLNRTGLDIFRLIGSSADEADVTRAVAERFALDDGGARSAVSSFLADLARERIVVPDDGSGRDSEALAPQLERRDDDRPFAPPELIRHDEPLHEVSTSPFDPQLPLAE